MRVKAHLRRAWFVLGGLIVICLLFLLIEKTTYPPLFRRSRPRITLVTIYSRVCGLEEPDDRSPLRTYVNGLHCSVYLPPDGAGAKPSFSGTGIKVYLNGERNGYDVAGQGRIDWGQQSIDVSESGIIINGKALKQGTKSAVLDSDGSFREDEFPRVY